MSGLGLGSLASTLASAFAYLEFPSTQNVTTIFLCASLLVLIASVEGLVPQPARRSDSE